MKYFFFILLTNLLAYHSVHAQDSIRYRVIFIGDAGEMNPRQRVDLQHAANEIVPGKTTVVYLGDNIYPRGMGLPGTKDETAGEELLKSQYQPMRAKGAPVYFVPGNHDWDRMGPDGLAKIRQQGEFLEAQQDSFLRLVPAGGCPDPVEISLTDSMTLIAYDSEWWLFPFQKSDEQSDCECKTRADVIAKLDELRYKNRNKIVLLASHHPFQSYGVHGGSFTLKDHLFPLTAANKNLYIPLPVIGSLYPLLRTVFTNPEDLHHPLYQDMIRKISGVFKDFPNVVYVAGHEHGLQFIKGERIQVISGAGAKHTEAKKGKEALFADAIQGYVTVDLLEGNTLSFRYMIYENGGVKNVFNYRLPYTKPAAQEAYGQPISGDSVTVRIHPAYDKVGKGHRYFFGENYRKEWATPVTLPVIHISSFHGGLKPLQVGGGMQSKSLRMEDDEKKEWVIRSVEKSAEKLLPEALQETFAKDVLDDITSAQHPFSALVVPPIADAVHVPHASPIIGVLSPDSSLGVYNRIFSNMVVLLEEREPLGKSDNSVKMKKNLQKDNENRLNAKEMFRARMLDMFLGDWDRHEDQWRWYDEDKGKDIKYLAVPRDRDQVFHVTQGRIPVLASKDYILPTIRNFDSNLSHPKWLVFKTRFVNAYPEMQFSHEEWTREVGKFHQALSDSVLEIALRRLPEQIYRLRHDALLRKLQSRREKMPQALEQYYRFIQKVGDIRLSDKNESVHINDAPGGGMQIRISRINKDGEIKNELMDKTFDPSLTKELRIFLGNGKDSVVVNNKDSRIKLRIIGGNDHKAYLIPASAKKIDLYDKENGSSFSGDLSRLKKHIGNDSANTAFEAVDLNNIWMPLVTAGLNVDDGFILGAGFRYTQQEGFRKSPYAERQQLLLAHSFSTSAYHINYRGEWIKSVGNADFTLQADIRAPDNTMNFFGRGNETVYNKSGDDKKFYRSRFALYQVDPALRWRKNKKTSFSIGPSLDYYRYDQDDNNGRFITHTHLIGSYDSLTIDRDKLHLGLAADYIQDTRNNTILPQWGSYIHVRFQAYRGMNSFSKSFAQVIPEVRVYKSLNAGNTLILADRLGGTIGIGKTTFYQSAFIGGEGNLLGYRQFRFAGQYSAYNNMELRLKLTDLANYFVAGQFGITGFWDIGRVWENHDNSRKWHNGTGGGIYFAPASAIVLNFVMANSPEGWYPYFTMGFRF
jgi:hypothetical protein